MQKQKQPVVIVETPTHQTPIDTKPCLLLKELRCTKKRTGEAFVLMARLGTLFVLIPAMARDIKRSVLLLKVMQ